MAWIKSYQELERHPKTMMLMNSMGWSLDTTIAKLHRLWWWCGDYAFDGNLEKHGVGTIALAVGLPLEEGIKFCDALVYAGFVDKEPNLRLHDWYTHFGEFLRSKFSKNPEVWKKVEASYRPVAVPQPSPSRPPDKIRKIDKKEDYCAEFVRFWSAYPKRVGKDAAYKSWKAHTPPIDKCLRTIAWQVKSDQWLKDGGQYIPMPSTWLNQGRWNDIPLDCEVVYCPDCNAEGMVKRGTPTAGHYCPACIAKRKSAEVSDEKEF